jgi:hypothetical protein
MKNILLFVLILLMSINAFGQKKKSRKKAQIKEEEIIHYVDRNTPFDTIIPKNTRMKFRIKDTTILETNVKSVDFIVDVFINDQLVNKLHYPGSAYCDWLFVYNIDKDKKDTLSTGISFDQGLIPKTLTSYKNDSFGNRTNIGNHTYFTDYDNVLKFIRIYKEDGKSYELRSYFETGELEFKTTFNALGDEVGPRIRYSKTKGIISKKTKGFTVENYEKFLFSTSEYNKQK